MATILLTEEDERRLLEKRSELANKMVMNGIRPGPPTEKGVFNIFNLIRKPEGKSTGTERQG